MAVESPARIAVLGAGPIGLEAALYARYLGYEVDLYERGRAAENLLQWGHVRMFTPFAASTSPLGISALGAQDSNFKTPPAEALITGREFAERFCLPLAHSDLLIDSIHEQTEVLAISRGRLRRQDLSGEDRAEFDFRLLLRSKGGGRFAAGERYATADVVIDCTGTYGNHNWLGAGGIPAIGELAAAEQIEYGVPDVLGRDRDRYAHHHTLVVGSDRIAASVVTSLARLGHEAPYTRITWVAGAADEIASAASAAQVESGEAAPIEGGDTAASAKDGSDPIRPVAGERWPARDDLIRAANNLIRGEVGHLTFRPATWVEQIISHGAGKPFFVRLAGQHAAEFEVDRIVANVGYRPDRRLYEELQIPDDSLHAAPTRWQSAPTAQSLMTPEPDFYILGSKSAGRSSSFTIADGLQQIRQLFTVIGDREELDLYKR
jgi:hypothetical protein